MDEKKTTPPAAGETQTNFLSVISWPPEEVKFLKELPPGQEKLVRELALAKQITPSQAWNELRETADKVYGN